MNVTPGVGFNNDPFIRTNLQKLILRYDIQLAIETGTHKGETAAALAELAPRVWTIEIDEVRALKAREVLRAKKNIEVFAGNSSLLLAKLLKDVKVPTLFYLDAHWRAEWPLLAELDAIAGSHVPAAVIAIHDFKVNGLGYDSYQGVDLDFDYVRRGVCKIFSDGFTFEQNSPAIAAGARRGIAYFHGIRFSFSPPFEMTAALGTDPGEIDRE